MVSKKEIIETNLEDFFKKYKELYNKNVLLLREIKNLESTNKKLLKENNNINIKLERYGNKKALSNEKELIKDAVKELISKEIKKVREDFRELRWDLFDDFKEKEKEINK